MFSVSTFSATIIFLAAMVLFVAGCIMVAIGLWWFANAVRMAHTARAHGAQADETEATVQQSQQALDELLAEHPMPEGIPLDNPARHAYDRPTDRDLLEVVLAGRNGHRDETYTTEQNEGIEEQPPIPRGGMYRQEFD